MVLLVVIRRITANSHSNTAVVLLTLSTGAPCCDGENVRFGVRWSHTQILAQPHGCLETTETHFPKPQFPQLQGLGSCMYSDSDRVGPQYVVILQMPSTPSQVTELQASDTQPPSLGGDWEATWACVGQGSQLSTAHAHQAATGYLGQGSSVRSTLSDSSGLGTRLLGKLLD